MERVSGEGGTMSKIRIQVFLVDTGAMYHVEASLNLPVTYLKESISKMTRIPVEKQVLLLSGGVPLFPDTPLCQYESVSDNTVFLVCKSSVPDIARPVTVSQRYSEEELLAQLDASIKMPAILETVRNRMLLVQSTCDIDKRELVEIRQLVFDQHLQQQGWAAVVAHLEEVCSGFRTRVLTFQKLFGEYINMREDIFALLRRMPDVLTLLGKIPVLACLENTTSSISVSVRGPIEREQPPITVSGSLTLYSWINTQARLEDVIHDVTCGTKQMGEQFEEAVNQEIEQVWQSVDGRPEMRCIGGIEERLYSLDKLTNNVKGIVDMQISTKEGFRSNWSRLEIEKDCSILPDLCASHRTQMHELRERHRKLVDLKKKCVVAKKELCNSIQSRLPWLMQIHQAISSLSSSLSLHHALLKRILRRVDILRQVEKAPQVYAMMVVEVVRRRLFSEYYIKWATGVAAESKKEHKKEAHRRRAFSKQCGPHFLKKMFIGFKDHVPKFATEPLEDIDHDLPSVTSADISHLSKSVPELQHLLRIPTDTGSPAIGPAFQQAHGDMDVDPFMIETTQSMASSTASFITRSITSVTQSVSEAGSSGAMLLLGERERDKLSLSYQGGERWREAREGGESKDKLFLSLQENIPVPQCLSETLTAEVNSAAMSTISVSVMSASPQSHEFSSALEELAQPQQQHPEGGGDGVLLSSGDLEPTKSSDSDIISHESQSEHKPRKKRRSVKGLSDTSPDAETSQEFATADFYFEDSMPSSIADSPPKPSGSGKVQGEVDAVLVEKAKRVDELEGKVCALQSKLAGSQEKLVSLHSVLNSDVSYLCESLGALRDSVRDSEGQRKQDLAEAQEVVGRLCSSLVESLDREKEELVRQEREGSRQTLEELEAKYQAKCQSMEELQQGMLKVSHCIADVNKELQQQRETSQREMESVREKHEEELRELRRQNMLEVELETDRVRAEMQRSLDEQDTLVQRLQQELQQASRDLAQALKEKEAASETLLLEFAEEKKQLQESLQAEKTQALEQVRAAVMAESKKEAESLLQKENEQKQSEVQQQLEALKSNQERKLAEQAEELQARHEAELVSVNTEWANKLAAQEASLREEFNTEVEKLKAELQTAAQTPEVMDLGVQSEDVSLRDQSVQSDVLSVSVGEQGVQSEPCEVGDHSVQWDFCWGIDNQAVQTDPPSVTEQSVQSDWQPDVCDHHSQTEQVSVDQKTQTEELPVCEQSVQSDSVSVHDQGIQGDTAVLNSQGVQSDSCAVVDQGTQSDVHSVSNQAVQCEDDDLSLPKHLRPSLSEAEPQASTEVSQLYEKLLAEQTERMHRKLAEVREQHMRDKEEAVQNCKRSILAERQISFNEAIAKAVRDKDAMIESLKTQLDVVTARGAGGEGESEEGPDLRKQLAGLKEQESDLKHKNRRLESEVLMLQQQLHQYSEQFQSMTASAATVSFTTAASTPMTQSTTEGAMARSVYLEQEARAKDQKISDLEKKLMEMSMTTSFRKEARDKVSILTCVAGDIVLLCLDERHDQYVVFTMGTTLHFLHSDCIDQLGLRPVEGEPRKNWVLAEVTDREYCQARKAQNRFKVPVNTKFYRVKAKPWVPKSSSSSS